MAAQDDARELEMRTCSISRVPRSTVGPTLMPSLSSGVVPFLRLCVTGRSSSS